MSVIAIFAWKCKKQCNIENETGYLVSGNARIEDNKLSFSITTDDEKIKEELKDKLRSVARGDEYKWHEHGKSILYHKYLYK